jgi:hypothetical protein
MSIDELPARVQELLSKRIESFEQLEILLFLYGCRDRSWTAQAVSEQVQRGSEALEALEALRLAGLVRCTPCNPKLEYGYAPVSAQLDEAVSELARAYREQPITVIRVMSANSIRRVRVGAARAFADAFVIQKKGDKHRG